MKKTIKIHHQTIGKGHPCFIIAEMSANHHNRFSYAKAIIDAAAQAGADAIKIQTYTADTMTINSNKKWFQITDTDIPDSWKNKTMYDLYKQGSMPWEWQPKLKAYAQKRGLILFSTPFDETAVDFLENMNVPCYKVASFEINHVPLLKKIGKTKKTVILSRGMATRNDIQLALRTLRGGGTKDIALLHCISAYPAKEEDMNLLTIPDIEKTFRVIPGLSDHTLGTQVAATAVALGARIIEKHLTLTKPKRGLDSSFSLTPAEFAKLVADIRSVEKTLGSPHYNTSGTREAKEKRARRSIFVVKNITKGETFTTQNIRVIRPSAGLHPKYFEYVLGEKAKKNISAGTPLKKTYCKKGL